jgi:hypothetical protein
MESLEEDYFGAGPEFVDGEEFCVDDVTFMSEGPWESGYCDIEAEINCVYDGVPCTIDAALARRAFNSKVTPSTNLASDPSDWPRNVFIANEALSAEALETILAGAEYLDDVDREDLAAVFQWFPALCAEKPSDSTLSYMETCRWEFLAITIMALSAELEEQEFINIKLEGEAGAVDDSGTALEDGAYEAYMDYYYSVEDLEWYQTAFMTMGNQACMDADLASGDVSDCGYYLEGWANTDGTGEDASQLYFERGFGVLGVAGSDEYSEFSKAVFGDEATLVADPYLMYTFSEGDFQVLPVAALVWRYMQSYHSGLPSGHDVVTGLWEPADDEVAAGMTGPHDFCTFVS